VRTLNLIYPAQTTQGKSSIHQTQMQISTYLKAMTFATELREVNVFVQVKSRLNCLYTCLFRKMVSVVRNRKSSTMIGQLMSFDSVVFSYA